MTDRIKCTVRDGLFVEPCETLARNTDNHAPGFNKAKGIFRQELTNMNTGQSSRTYYGIKSKAHPNGFLFNVCPFCGEDISAPFTSDEEGQE